jgi:uncharacterized membrane protein
LSEVSFPLTGTADKRGIGAALRRTQALQLRRWLIDQRLALLTLSLFALGARLWGLGERSFWLDELISLGSAALNLPDFLFALGVEANMTLYYWMLFFWLRVVGVGASEALIRLPSVVLGTAAIPPTAADWTRAGRLIARRIRLQGGLRPRDHWSICLGAGCIRRPPGWRPRPCWR